MSFTDAIAKAAAANPQGAGSVHITPGRILLADGDGLAYYCAGNDDTDPGQARSNLTGKLAAARRAVGAEEVRILVTAPGSHKGHRYAIARVKPYQGQRAGGRRPKNWAHLRDYLLSGNIQGCTVQTTATAEADDLFGWWAYNYPDDVVLYTQDKDMRMLPGLHLDWVSHLTHRVDYCLGPYVDKYRAGRVLPLNSTFNDKQYGPLWFWLQMLHGDTADNIPGLPKHATTDAKGKPALKPVGEVTAGNLLAGHNDPALRVAELYQGFYKERWLPEFIEQACLLWMRRDPECWYDCLEPGGPLAFLDDGSPAFQQAFSEIELRVRTADLYNQAQDHEGS